MRKAEERRIAHQIVTAGRSNPCEYEYVETNSKITHGQFIAIGLSILMFTLVLNGIGIAKAGTTTITTYFQVQSQVSISVSFPTGLTNISFLDTTPHAVANISAVDQTLPNQSPTPAFATTAAEITDTGDTNITTMTAVFNSPLPSSGIGNQITYFQFNIAWNDTFANGIISEGPNTGINTEYWTPSTYSTAMPLLKSGGGDPSILNPYSYPLGSWAENIYLAAWATFPANVYAGHATDIITITFNA